MNNVVELLVVPTSSGLLQDDGSMGKELLISVLDIYASQPKICQVA